MSRGEGTTQSRGEGTTTGSCSGNDFDSPFPFSDFTLHGCEHGNKHLVFLPCYMDSEGFIFPPCWIKDSSRILSLSDTF
jgi:hypothetical protein